MIVAAACIVDGIVKSLPAPARHYTILHSYPLPEHEHGEQGFIDDIHGFVDRKKAGQIAITEGQITEMKWPPRLFSEDLW